MYVDVRNEYSKPMHTSVFEVCILFLHYFTEVYYMDIRDLEIWKALYIDKFNESKYLYHYTSAETAMKILHNNTLLFGKLSSANDTTESKIRLSYDMCTDASNKTYSEKCKAITNYLRKNKDGFQLLCFSMDTHVQEKMRTKYLHKVSEKEAYYDVYGRGFALPRMWAQYAHNHNGVCFVFNKEKLIEKVKSDRSFYKASVVHYADILSTYHISEKQVNSIYNKIKLESNGDLPYLSEMKNNDFLKYNFFEKSSDWSNEQEYRILIYVNSSQSERQKVMNIDDAIEGIVVGERMDETQKSVLRMLFKKTFKKKNIDSKELDDRFKQICFKEQICRLT